MAHERTELRERVELRKAQLLEGLKQAEADQLPDEHIVALRTELSVLEASLSGGWSNVSEVTAAQLSSWLQGTKHLVDSDPGGMRDTQRVNRVSRRHDDVRKA